ncbi:hypothetical protein Pint_33485 [Pistacia integerrima]|uniref:Uncharacterized protein n=1 Tax=Pistacia integerrima TaxID=434235 RepID=A0ACC0X7N5_9ROSI|nr:hypothetical protein Pint_33485 [Pistacia integerrima]
MQDINYGGVTKSWRAQPRQCNNSPAIPLRLERNDIRNDDRNYKFRISFHKGKWCWPGRRPWQEPWKHCVGYSDGLLVAKGGPVEGFYLDYCTKMHWGGYRSLPPWNPNIPFQRAVVYSLPPNSWGRCEISIMVLTGISHPAFVFPRLKEGGNYIYEWIMQDCTIADPHCTSSKSDKRNFMQFTNAIGHKGKFYALSLQGTLAVIEDINSHLRITALGRKPALPSVSSRHFRECILESNGEILLVFLISCNSINIVDDVEVFQLDIGTFL